MSLSKLGFFNNKTAAKKQYHEKYLSQLTKNIKDNTLKKILLCYLQHELQSLALNAAAAETITKQKSNQLRYKLHKRKEKRRIILRRQRAWTIEANQQKLREKSISADNVVSHSLITEQITPQRQ
jgi:hypothetical protein